MRENGVKGMALFERKAARGRNVYKLFSSTIFIAICLIWLYRILNVPKVGENGRFVWIGMFISELIFGGYWIITQSARWNFGCRVPFKDRLLQRYEDKLPDVDIYVCTADPVMEPPVMVINTVLSAMAFNYPPEKLSIYLSDDGGSEFTFYALLEASKFSKHWLPFCRKFNVEPRSPAAYFAKEIDSKDEVFEQECSTVKKLYGEMTTRIETAMEKGSVSKEVKYQHKGFSEWNSKITKKDHQSIVQILIDRRDFDAVDIDGYRLPMLVYLSREKRPQQPHHFKAGSMNALLRVSSEISNAPLILNLDCDMYVNDPDALREALCFFLDETEGHEVAFVQFPQRFGNITKNDIYANVLKIIHQIELAGVGGYGAALYCGTGCVHRRESLCGKKFSRDTKAELNSVKEKTDLRTVEELEEAAKVVANCSYEEGTQWGKEMGLVYGCPVEDVLTGLTIQCRGWKSFYYNPSKYAFIGIAPSTLDLALIQYKRWSEGLFQIFLSKYCPFIYGHGKIKLGAQMGYCTYLMWPITSFPTLFYAIIPSLCMIHDVPMFPEVTSLWFLPFAYAFCANYANSFAESMYCNDTIKGWWNFQRMTLIRRTTSFLLGGIDTVIRQLGFTQTSFVLTPKVVDDDALKRYEQEIMEFGSSSIMFTITATIAVLNLFTLMWEIKKILFTAAATEIFKHFIPHMILNGLLVLIYLPVYEAMFLRGDKGRLPSSVMFKSIVIASMACLIRMY